MSEGERYAAKARAYHAAFRDLPPEQRSMMKTALADFQEECDARPDQTTFEPNDAAGRVQAFREGKRQAYLYLERLLALTAEEINREAERLDQEQAQALALASADELQRRARHAA